MLASASRVRTRLEPVLALRLRLERTKTLSTTARYCLGSRRGTEVAAVLLKKCDGARADAVTALECRDGDGVVRRPPLRSTDASAGRALDGVSASPTRSACARTAVARASTYVASSRHWHSARRSSSRSARRPRCPRRRKRAARCRLYGESSDYQTSTRRRRGLPHFLGLSQARASPYNIQAVSRR